MEAVSLGVVISFTAGLLSFLSPCVLPLIPSYVTFVTGLSLEDIQRSRKTALVHALLFVAGFSLIFLALGATATAVGMSRSLDSAVAVAVSPVIATRDNRPAPPSTTSSV